MERKMSPEGFPVALGEVTGFAWRDDLAPTLRAVWRWVLVVIAEERAEAEAAERQRIREALTDELKDSDSWWWLEDVIDRICPEVKP